MKHQLASFVLALLSLAGCDSSEGPFRTPWHAEKLASGNTVKVVSFNLVWGAEHDEHTLGKDCFAIEYVTSFPEDDNKREAEIGEVFELLVRPASEQWAFGEATVAAMPTPEGRGRQDLYWFVRQPDGHWASKQIFRKGQWIQNSESSPPK